MARKPSPAKAEALARVQQLEKRSRAKINRTKRVNNFDVVKAGKSPIRDKSVVSRYTAKQLESYAKDLERFNSRSTVFYGDANGRELDPFKYQAFIREQSKRNRRLTKEAKELGRLRDPYGRALLTGLKMRHDGNLDAAIGLFDALDRGKTTHRNINGNAALDRYLKGVIHRNNGGEEERTAQIRSFVRQTLVEMGAHEELEDLDALSDRAFRALIVSDAVSHFKYIYEVGKMTGEGREDKPLPKVSYGRLGKIRNADDMIYAKLDNSISESARWLKHARKNWSKR